MTSDVFAPYLLPDEQILWIGSPPDENGSLHRPTKHKRRRSKAKAIAIFLGSALLLFALVMFEPDDPWSEMATFAGQAFIVVIAVLLLGAVIAIVADGADPPDYGRVWSGQEHYAITDRRLLVLCGDERYSLFGRNALTSIEVAGRGERQTLVLHSAEDDDETASVLRDVEDAAEAERLLLSMFAGQRRTDNAPPLR